MSRRLHRRVRDGAQIQRHKPTFGFSRPFPANPGLSPGDIGAANLTITPERLRSVDFADPGMTGVDELVVTGPASPSLDNLTFDHRHRFAI